MADQPVEIASVTPYEPPQPMRRPTRLDFWAGLGWLLAAGLAVLASFATVYSLTVRPAQETGADAGLIRFSLDGWGRTRTVHVGSAAYTAVQSSGPRYGVLFCLAAGVMLLGWLLSLRVRTARPTVNLAGGFGAVFLLGVVACQLVVTEPARHGLPTLHPILRLGLSPWLAGGAGLLGLLLWVGQQHATGSPGTDRITS